MFENNTLRGFENLDLNNAQTICAYDEVEEGIRLNNILSAPTMNENTLCFNRNMSDVYKGTVNTLLLEVTEKCNLRCSYCIYNDHFEGYRNFGQDDMEWSIARKAIDFIIENCDENKKIHIGFYGGEPLLKFELIKECIKYSKSKVDPEKLSFGITTNCTLLTKEISDYILKEKNIYITVSLDGPKDIHDKYRVYSNKSGSFEDTMKGIKNLFLTCDQLGKDPANIIAINTVIDYPETEEKYNKIQNFFKSHSLLSTAIQKNYSYASHGPERIEYRYPNSKEEKRGLDELYRNHDSIAEWTIKHLKEKEYQNNLKDSNLFSYADLNEMLIIVHSRRRSLEPNLEYRLNACCIPGSRRLYVEVNGEFKPCERTGFAPILGNVKDGFEFENIKKNYFENFSNNVIKYCNNCWASNICGVCYIDAFDEKGVNFEYRHRHCEAYRKNLELAFSVYHEILEKNPTSLKHLNEVVFN